MAKAFWTLEDGRGLARRWSGMSFMLQLITDELKEMEGARDFYEYLERFVFRDERGDEYNGYGGFFRGDDHFMLNLDLRTFTPKNRNYFWEAAQKALTRIKIENNKQNEGIEPLFTTLLDMHKRIKKGEDPMLLNDMTIIEPDTFAKLGPGW